MPSILKKNQTQNDMIATSGDEIRIWESNQNENYKLKCELKSTNKPNVNSPITSFDWNLSKQNVIGTSSVDTICTLFDVEKKIPVTQLVAHEKEVYDFCFNKNGQLFATAGGDSCVRTFDIRDLAHYMNAFENKNSTPFLRVVWNHENENLLATIMYESSEIIIIDLRYPNILYEKLINHELNVNAISWSPNFSQYICSGGEDGRVLLWDLVSESSENILNSLIEPSFMYEIYEPINNIYWNFPFENWIIISFGNKFQILKL